MEDTSAAFLLDTVIANAVETACSDVHISTSEECVRVLFRMRGQLVPYLESERSPSALLRRLKALARLNLAEHRIPQEGTFQWEVNGKKIDIRVSIVPTATGISTVLRIHPRLTIQRGLPALGMTPRLATKIEHLAARGGGLLLVAGTTGSGKTTTVYALMRQLAASGYQVASIEDPVEVPQAEFIQLEVREELGLGFAWGLRALLRQDPDVVMVGEIRDEETARIVLNAALTGHFVISTTHGADVVTAVARLVEFGLSRPLLADVFKAVLVQRYGPQRNDFDRDPLFNRGDVDNESPISFQLQEMTLKFRSLLLSGLPWSEVRHQLEDPVQKAVHWMPRFGG